MLEQAIATTFTLDLETALIPPLMTLGLGNDAEDARRDGAKLALHLRHAADRMMIFMEAGHLSNHRSDEEVYVLLAPMLREVLVPGEKHGHRSFHPKVWAIHFKPLDGSGAGSLRLVVSSRNLTRSMSRDAMVVLEGTIGPKAIEQNAPLTKFLRTLPSLVVSQGKEDSRAAETKTAAERMADLAGKTSFKPPPGFKLEGFSFAGPNEAAPAWKPQKCARLSVISPFCDADTLKYYASVSTADKLWLVSRQATLDGLTRDLVYDKGSPWSAYAFDEAARLAGPETIDNPEGAVSSLAERSDQLHAKIFVEEGGRAGTRLTIGSGNATSPARKGRNIEFYVTLTTKSDQTSLVPSFENHENTSQIADFGSFLKRYEPADAAEPGGEDEDGEFDPRVRFAIYELLDRHFSLLFEPHTDRHEWVCRFVCHAEPDWKRVSNIQVRVKPAPAHEDTFTDITGWAANRSYNFSSVPVVELSPFMTFELSRDGVTLETFTTQLPHEGFPDNIHLAAVMRKKLPAASDWLSALMASLNGKLPDGGGGGPGRSGLFGSGNFPMFSETTPLLETLISNLDNPEALMAFARTLTAFGEAVYVDEDNVSNQEEEDQEVLNEKLQLYQELTEFWQVFEGFLPDQKIPRRGSS